MKLKIAIVQFEIAQFTQEANLRKAERYIAEAVASDAHLIVFPEDFVTGPIHGSSEGQSLASRTALSHSWECISCL